MNGRAAIAGLAMLTAAGWARAEPLAGPWQASEEAPAPAARAKPGAPPRKPPRAAAAPRVPDRSVVRGWPALHDTLITSAIEQTPTAASAPLVAAAAAPPPSATTQPFVSPGEQFCANVADRAADARFLAQKQQIAQVQAQLDARVAALDAKIEEYRAWVARRDAFAEKAQRQLVDIYSRMTPDAAAPQLALMDEETAAALLIKLNVRNASAVLNAMQAEKAARLSTIIAGAAARPPAATGSVPQVAAQ